MMKEGPNFIIAHMANLGIMEPANYFANERAGNQGISLPEAAVDSNRRIDTPSYTLFPAPAEHYPSTLLRLLYSAIY